MDTARARTLLRALLRGGAVLTSVMVSGCHGGTVHTDTNGASGRGDDAAVGEAGRDASEGDGDDALSNSDGAAGDGDAPEGDGASGDGDGTMGDGDGASGPVSMCTGALTNYEGNASATMYWFDQGTVVPNCSYPILERGKGTDRVAGITTGGGRYFAAINTADYAAAAACGECVEVARDDGRTVIVTVVDQCPISSNDKCVAGHIDLSVAAFLQLGTEGEGYLGERAGQGRVSLRHVSCPEPETIKLALKEPANPNWNQLLVMGHRHPLASVEVQVGGSWSAATRESYNYWTPPAGGMGASPYRVRLTDVYDHTVQGEVALNESGFRDTGQQFPDCTP